MMLLSFNHGAKGVMSWTFPTSDTLAQAHSQMAKIATVPPVSTFLLGAQPTEVEVKGQGDVDVAYWKVGKRIMVGFVRPEYDAGNGKVTIDLPERAGGIASQPWGSLPWTLEGQTLTVRGLVELDTSLVILDVV